VGNRRMAQFLTSALGVKVDPLQVIRGLGKPVDAGLCDLDPVSRAGCLANPRNKVFGCVGNKQRAASSAIG
jgi:hypothetical protein